MKYVPKEKAQRFEHDNIIAYEYDTEDNEINCGVVEVKARHPKTGWIFNTKCKEIVYIAKGSGVFTTESESIHFKEGDMIFMDIMEKYFWEGNCILVAPATPAWTLEQQKTAE